MKRKITYYALATFCTLPIYVTSWAEHHRVDKAEPLKLATTQIKSQNSTAVSNPKSTIDFEEFPFTVPDDVTQPATQSADALGSELINNPRTKPGPKLTVLPEDENSLRLLEIKVGAFKMDDLITAYQVKDTIFIPLGHFSELIDLAILTNPDKGTAEGFVFNEDKHFFMDANRGEITLSGKIKKIDLSRVAVRELDDIYVDSYLLGEFLPMKLNIDLFASRLEIIPDQLLPFQSRKRREERIKQARSQHAVYDRGYPRYDIPYQPWSYPIIDQTAKLGVFRNANGDTDTFMNYSTYVTADLMNMESSWFLAGNENDLIEESRVTFAKRDPRATLLGPMQATEYAFGHLNESRIELINQPIEPRPGVTITNYPLTRQLQYDSHDFIGNLPPGWEVELYHNNALLDYINSSTDGLYRFDDIPLLFGNNYFRLVFYGPQGQQREETYNFNLNKALTQPGKHHYRAYISDDDDFGARTILQYDGGINKQLSIAGTFSSIPIDNSFVVADEEKNHNYVTLGIRSFFSSAFFKADYINDIQSGSAFDWETQGRLGSVILDVGETYFNETFVSEQFNESANPIERRTTVKLDTAIPTSYFPRIPISLDYLVDRRKGGAKLTQLANRISAQKHGFSISNTLNLNQQTGFDDLLSDTIQFSRRAFGYNYRGAMSYQIKPENELSTTSITADGFKLWGNHVSTGYSRVVQSDIDEVYFNLNRTRGAFALGLNMRYSTGGVITIDLSFSMGLGREPRTGNWQPEYRPIANQGAMSVQAYLDKNLNNRKDSEDESLPGVKVRINGGGVQQEADENGIVYVTGVEPYREIDVDIAVETLEDPLWQPSEKGKRISLRPGYIAQIDFPVMITGEVDGTAYIKIGNQNRGVSGVIVELLDTNGRLVQKIETAYDGFFLFSKIPSGKYQLRVSREQTDALNLLPVKPTFVVVEPDNPIVNGMDFVLQKRSSE